ALPAGGGGGDGEGEQRQGDVEDAAAALAALGPDAAAVALADLATDGQAEAGAGGFVGERVAVLVELVEDALLVAGGQADAAVGDIDEQLAVAGVGADLDGSLVGELEGVAEQVAEHLA